MRIILDWNQDLKKCVGVYDNYEGATDSKHHCIGYGRTYQEALDDLLKCNECYPCDRCETPINSNEEAHEVKYGFICKSCAEV